MDNYFLNFLTIYLICSILFLGDKMLVNSKKMLKEAKRKKKAVFQIALIICGITMLCYGALRGEAETVLSKAIRLCLECVGIG